MNIPKLITRHKIVSTIGAVTLFLVGGIAVAVWALFHRAVYCQTWTDQVIPGSQDYEVKVFERGCDGWGGSDTMSVLLSSKKWWERDRAIFVYGRMNADPKFKRQDVPPTVVWVSDREIRISIDMVANIKTKVSEVDGIRVDYQIGAVEYQ